MNLGEIVTRVQRSFGDVTETVITIADIKRWANDAQLDIAKRGDHLEGTVQISTVVGQKAYTLASTVFGIRRVELNGYKLNETNIEELDQYYADRDADTTYGNPTYWYLYGGSLYLYPTPDTAITNGVTAFVRKLPATLVNDPDIPEVPIYTHEAIVDYCLFKAKEQDDDFDEATKKRQDYEGRLSEDRYIQQADTQESYPVVRDYDPDYWNE